MKVVTFYRPDPTIATPTSERYACSEAGDSGGPYVPLAEVEEMQNQMCFASILAGLLGLLNGETGRLDCGTLDGLIREIGRLAGVVDENGEIRE